MMFVRTGQSTLLPSLAAIFWGAAICAAGEPRQPRDELVALEPLVGMTVAARDVSLGPIQVGRLSNILVHEGDTVNAGDLLFSFSDAVARARVAMAKLDAEATCRIELAQERWKQAKREHDRLASLQSTDSASSKELEDAFSRMEVVRLEHEVEENRTRMLRLAYEREKASLEELYVRAPFAGYVAEQLRFVGETPDQREAVLRVVQLDPLYVVLDCPLWLEPLIALGDVVEVTPAERHWSVRPGRVIMKRRIADAASQTFRVKVAVGNPDLGWMSGMKVLATLPRVTRPTRASKIEGPPAPKADARRLRKRVATSAAERG